MRHRFALFTVGFTFFVLFMGVLVTATQSQDACGTDWPGCNGRLFPDITDYKQVIEYTHRLVVGLLGFILLINAIFAWIKKYPGERAVSILSPLSLFLLFLQVLVGGFNVMLGTPPGFTTLDVAVSLALFSSLVFLTTALMRRGTEEKKSPEPIGGERGSKLFGPALTLLLLFYAETILGAFFKHSAAADVYMGITPHQQLIQSPYCSFPLLYPLDFRLCCPHFLASPSLSVLADEEGEECGSLLNVGCSFGDGNGIYYRLYPLIRLFRLLAYDLSQCGDRSFFLYRGEISLWG
ncbi:membrane hypothetical protein [[Clostridium] ultunense Esp]|nr:membrane hypothetical protein [[Clostridium] ultunense Esp]